MKLKEWRGNPSSVQRIASLATCGANLPPWILGVRACHYVPPALEEAADMGGRRGSRKRLSLSAANGRLTRAARKVYWFMNSNQNA